MMKKTVKTILQVMALCLVSQAGNLIAQALAIGMLGSVMGMAILFTALEYRLIPLSWIEAGANFLIAEMILFFIPSAIGVIQFQELLRQELPGLLLVILSSSTVVIVFVGLATEWISYCRTGRKNI